MSTRRDLKKDHKCVFSKCRGTLLDPPESYGYWAYWYADDPRGWHSKPKG